jgi:Tfp pilus assembly protein PilO
MTHRTDRIWLLGGIVVVALLAVASWFLVIHPRYTDANAVRDQIGDETVQLTKLRHQVADLDAQQKQKPALLRKLKAYQTALPPSNDMTAFVRQIQASSTAVSVDVSIITLGTPVKSDTQTTVLEVPIALTVTGTADNVSKFLVRLQSVQARAVLISTVGLSAATTTSGGTTASGVTASLSLTAFESTTGSGSTGLTTK